MFLSFKSLSVLFSLDIVHVDTGMLVEMSVIYFAIAKNQTSVVLNDSNSARCIKRQRRYINNITSKHRAMVRNCN